MTNIGIIGIFGSQIIDLYNITFNQNKKNIILLRKTYYILNTWKLKKSIIKDIHN
jgi:hypothetical protein